MMAGLEQLVDFLERIRYSPEELDCAFPDLFSSDFVDSRRIVDVRSLVSSARSVGRSILNLPAP